MELDNTVLSQLLTHRSIRHFKKDKRLTDDQINTLVDAAQHASTSTFSQQYSIISITDEQTKAALAEVTGHRWLMDSAHYFVVIADQYRNLQIAKSAGADPAILKTTDKFLASVFDAAIATENIVVAAESMGLGATIMGSILNDSERLIELLQLPELTFPLLGIAVGYPDDNPELKPRLPQAEMHFENTYHLPAPTVLENYDNLVAAYYQARGSNNRQETFSHHIVAELGRNKQIRAELLDNIRAQGFLVDAEKRK